MLNEGKNLFLTRVMTGVGFILSTFFVLKENISLPEFCWSFWVSGLFYSWTLVICGCARILLSLGSDTPQIVSRIPLIRDWDGYWQKLISGVSGIVWGSLIFYLYCWLFGFYGIFLSVFARMEPYEYFGENGFINSDFFTPVLILLGNYWPIVMGTLLAGLREIFEDNPWRLVVRPFSTRMVMIHVMVLAVPFFSILAWLLFRDSYQPMVIVALLAVFTFFFQRPDQAHKPAITQTDTGKNEH